MPGQYQIRPFPNSGQFIIVNLLTSNCLSVNPNVNVSVMLLVDCGNPKALGSTILWNITFNNDTNSTWSIVSASTKNHATMSAKLVTVEPFAGRPGQRWQFYSLPPPAGLPSVWSPPIPLPVIAIAAAQVSDGRILIWAAACADDVAGYQPAVTYAAFFDPAAGQASPAFAAPVGANMFCPGTVKLPDGSIFVAGGVTARATATFNGTGWTPGPPLNIPRAYNSAVTLSDGAVFTLGGSYAGGLGGKTGELWRKGAGWRVLGNVRPEPVFDTADTGGLFRRDNHMWLFAAAGGWVFHAGPSRAMHWVDTAGDGAVVGAGARADDGDAMNGNAVLYDAVAGRILTVGGGPNYNSVGTSNAFVIDISAGPGGNVTVARTGRMNRARQFCTSVALPSGEVVVVGGQSVGYAFRDSNAVLSAEVWSPATGTFSLLAWAPGATPMVTPRVYHSVALLLPDGRVFSSGGNGCGACPFNHLDAQIITPPYLLGPDGAPAPRPSLVSAPAAARLGETVLVTAAGARSFALMRASSTTHAVNTDQRRIPLDGVPVGPAPAAPAADPSQLATPPPPSDGGAGATVYALTIPADPGVAVPGDYMLFALGPSGTPSTALAVSVLAPAAAAGP